MPTKSGRILIVDDNPSILSSLEQLLKFDFEEIKTLTNPNLLISLIKTNAYDVVLLDMNFKAGINKGDEGFFWMKEILKNDPLAVIILITAYADIELAVKAIKEGATDFIAKPWNPAKLIATLKSAVQLKKSKLEVQVLKIKEKGLSAEINRCNEEIIGTSPKITEVLDIVAKVAPTDANVLIIGENGTGKELIARQIHKLSNQSTNPFISVDVSSLSESLLESELFGHEKGSFTDAKMERVGRFEIASNGTLFLDEIGNISFNQQAKLLTVIENRKFSRIGSNTPIETNFRLISATNKNLNDLTAQNQFREDLFYRINTIQIQVPPIRERKEDIPLIVEHYLRKYEKKYGKQNLKVSANALEKLTQHSWPGNIRELKHVIERAIILSGTTVLKPEDFFVNPQNAKSINEFDSFRLDDIEKQILIKVLNDTNWNLTKASKLLDISRTTLYSKIQRHGL
ncbi:MAG: sigma-54-dependent Fis family transcriptional regulator [Bacteroidetes bacterium GWF2_33_16]|nr:MAG: sigma-54-dependent Fis family transcriptional regulator [Bacteroidetes bacterium GWE2_32_14]OFY04030.1 MAG: sigma-54-dependent Fis family transcriptional regulator [Bacteroidetes bacterium GWF2_33_16]